MASSHMLLCPADLIAWREKNGVSLSAIAAATKISRRYLEAIESGKFQSLPGGVYNLSYIRQYAQAIQFEEEEILEYYRSSVSAPEFFEKAAEEPESWTRRARRFLSPASKRLPMPAPGR